MIQLKPHIIRFTGLFTYPTKDPEWFLKTYSIMDSESSKPLPIMNSRNFLEREIKEEHICKEKKKGYNMGFTMLSEGLLNVALWSPEGSNLVLKNILYEFLNCDLGPKKVRRCDMNEEAAYCLFEAMIVGHEARAMRQLIQNGLTEKAITNWQYDRLEGKL